MPHTFHAAQWLPFPLPLVFLFFSDPDNLPRLMPRWQQPRIEQATFAPPPPAPPGTPPSPGVVAGPGTRMTLTFRALPGLPFRLAWDAQISEFVWNDHFCDIINGRGPFTSWRHCHRLSEESRPVVSGSPEALGTWLHDEVEYTLPLGVLGRVANRLAVHRQIAALFRLRQQRTAELLPHFVAQLRAA